jgi:DNA-binding XRE family transcriptional regulator
MCISGLFCNRKDVRNRRLTKRNDGLVAFLRHFRHTGDRKERQVAEMTTGEKIAALRKEQGMSQEALGEKLGLSRQAVSKWENGTSDPSTSNLCALAKLYGIPVEELLHETQEEKSED